MSESGLIDQFGAPITRQQIALLREEISPIGAIHARPAFAQHIAFGVNPQRLALILRGADTGNTLDWWILAEEIEELWPHLAACYGKRRRQVVQLPITVAAADDKTPEYQKHADFVRGWLDKGVLELALFDVADAVGKGFSVHEIIWEQGPGYCRPAELLYRPQRFFEFDFNDAKTIWLRSESGFDDLVPHKFLVHRHPSKSGNIARSGLTRMLVFLWCYATFTLKDWALFTQAYGLPIRVGKYGLGASDSDKRVLWRAVSSIAGDVAAIIPDSMTMDFISEHDKAAGSELYLKRLDWLDRQVSKVVLGGTAGMDAIAGGHAVGREHREGEQDVEKFDAGLLNTSINRQLIQAMIAFTFGPQDAYPRASLGRPNEIPIKDIVEAVADLAGMGLKVKASQIRERLQLEEPEDGDDVIGGVPPPPPPPVDIPRPVKVLPADGQSQRPAWLAGLLSLHSQAPDDALLETMTARLAADAAGALSGLTEAVRAQFDAAEDMHDLAHRLKRLNLPRGQFAEAMQRGMALAELVGQASIVAEMRGQR